MKFADHYKMENYTSAYFKASTMDDDEIHTLTISEARLSNFKSGDVKITLDFVEDRRSLTLNENQVAALASTFGEDTNDCLGRTVRLTRDSYLDKKNGETGYTIKLEALPDAPKPIEQPESNLPEEDKIPF